MKAKQNVKFYSIKDEIRIAGFDDSHFELGKSKIAIVVGAVMRGGAVLDGVLRTEVEVDGTNATERLIGLTLKIRAKTMRGFKSKSKVLAHSYLANMLRGENGTCDLRKII